MLKRIAATDLRMNMYIQELCGSWMEHPFWRTSFHLRDPDDLRRIHESGIREVWIDTDKGPDVASGVTVEVVEARIEDELLHVAEAAVPEPESLDTASELSRAAEICARSKEAVTRMFSEARMGRAVDIETAAPLVEEISQSLSRNPGALISVARLKSANEYTYMHSVAVCGLMIALARQLGLSDAAVREAGQAGLLHDIGKIAIPTDILDKPGKLNDTEFTTMRRHPEESVRILSLWQGVSAATLDVCLHHHEKVDGTGYPHRLAAGDISLHARMGAVCDVYDAITSDRPYKKGWDPGQAMRRMAEWKDGHFDEKIFQAFVKAVGIYPPGTLVRLLSGRLAVVCEQAGKQLLRPTVRVFFDLERKQRIVPELLDLAAADCRDRIQGHEDPARWPFSDLDALWLPGGRISW